ncbi:hypothetical protein [Salinimicrobium soli]|uniref:hypothetical protein n=1 Tax=Salinimicrobium soli TaxID=1254399 RepID=UPI003AAF8252
MKKFFVIFVLFALPLVAYLFFASGVNNFARLPVLNSEVYPLENFRGTTGENVTFEGNITILGFAGEQPYDYLVNAYHLAEKIYNPYHEFNDFQLVVVLPESGEEQISQLKTELAEIMDLKKWKFVVGSEEDVKKLFSSLGANFELDDKLFTPNVFIVDKDGKLRGREEDEDGNPLFGYDTGSIAVLNNKMTDDVKVILAEYRLELKKYNRNRK